MRRPSYNYLNDEWGHEELLAAGPVLPAAWALCDADFEIQTEDLGVETAPPVVGHVLIDTGANMTSIRCDIAQKHFRMLEYGTAEIYDASSHLRESPTYMARLVLFNFSPPPNPTPSPIGSMELEVATLAYGEQPTGERTLQLHGEQFDLIGILGRDVLRLFEFSYVGTDPHYQALIRGRVQQS